MWKSVRSRIVISNSMVGGGEIVGRLGDFMGGWGSSVHLGLGGLDIYMVKPQDMGEPS